MATPVRSDTFQWFLLNFLLFTFLLPCVSAFPLHTPAPLTPRSFIINNSTGTPQVFNPVTRQPIAQGLATDGGGTGFNVPALIWLVFSFVVGAPMAIAGMRCWRVTTGVGIGLSAAVCSWAALNNTVNNNGLPDAVLTAIVLGFFVIGFAVGLFEIGRVAGITLIGITGGLAFGARIVLLRPGLLIQELAVFFVNWLVVTLFGVVGGGVMVSQRTQRGGILFGSASIGTFFIGLGVDLIVNKQSGMSRGLRFLFDRNSSHAVDIIIGGYIPPMSTQIQIGVSLGLTPILALIQHRVFKQPFSRRVRPDSEELTSLPDFMEAEEKKGDLGQGARRSESTFLFNLWGGAQTMKASAAGLTRSRFSV